MKDTDYEVQNQVRNTMTDAGYEKHEGIVQASDVYMFISIETVKLTHSRMKQLQLNIIRKTDAD